MKLTNIILFLTALFLLGGTVFAVEPDEILTDTVLENRARELSAKLRCLVCRNENIDSSDASLARDLRILVRERLVLGESDEEVIDYIHARYGDFVLLQPKFSGNTLILWFSAPFLLIIGLFLIYLNFFQQKKNRSQEYLNKPLSKHERDEIQRLLEK